MGSRARENRNWNKAMFRFAVSKMVVTVYPTSQGCKIEMMFIKIS